MKKILIFLLLLISYIAWSANYTFNVDKATAHLTNNYLSKSHTCCAWFVMRALQAGGCPISIYPAWMYSKVLPLYGFVQIPKENYTPKKGDIVVFEKTEKHIWGHIAMYSGKNWISDFKQKTIFVYKDKVNYNIYRHKIADEY